MIDNLSSVFTRIDESWWNEGTLTYLLKSSSVTGSLIYEFALCSRTKSWKKIILTRIFLYFKNKVTSERKSFGNKWIFLWWSVKHLVRSILWVYRLGDYLLQTTFHLNLVYYCTILNIFSTLFQNVCSKIISTSCGNWALFTWGNAKCPWLNYRLMNWSGWTFHVIILL